MKRIALIWASAALLLAVPASAHGDGNAARGKTVAERHCARCHVVGDFNPYGGIGSTPSFQLLAHGAPIIKMRGGVKPERRGYGQTPNY